MKRTVLTLAVIAVLASCSPSTKIVKTWMEPGASVTPGSSNKTLVIAMVKDETSRRVIEDELAKRLNANAVASYTIITAEAIKEASEDALNQKLKQGGFTHILQMSMGDVEKETSYVPGTTSVYYGGYGRYYGHSASLYSTPGYVRTDKTYFVETTVYSVNPNKLLWTGTTKTMNPTKLEKAVNGIADVVASKMKKEGFLK